MEREADRGLGLMDQPGFCPQGFVGMFDKLQQANRINDNGSWPYLRSHPLTTAAHADMQSRLPSGRLTASSPLFCRPSFAMVTARRGCASGPNPVSMCCANGWRSPWAHRFCRHCRQRQAGVLCHGGAGLQPVA